ncbi:hypothetical protein Y1Q_0000745 [Alligator mississippiensis]|uniref:Uncharacterized protein n=1 Tax=Alligator mississippiensis TaxID=8496 RepID=A0A151MCE3_ALLMI|nr:hypothetical protein Y1Q_0000745 [Alligator mississippiensis]
MKLVKGTPSHLYYLKIQVQQRIQEHPMAVNLHDMGRLDPINILIPPSPNPYKSSGLPTTIPSIFSGFSFNWFTLIWFPTEASGSRVRRKEVAELGVISILMNDSPVHYKSDDNSQGPLYSLDNNHSHFILVDQIDPDEPDGTTKLRLTLEKHISEQRTGYGACKSHSQEAQEYLDELKLAVAWNRVDIAKSEIFNGDVEWKSCDLEEVMMDALVNDKPEFVKLFIDNGANMYDFLTYSRLQRLYCSISQKSLLYSLLLKKHEESKLTLAGLSGQQHREVKETCPLFTLNEVSRVLKDFLHDACKGFYQEAKQGSKKKYGQEGVAAALAACKIVKEMSRLETETEVARIMKEAKYEQLAVELFSECYHNSEDRAFALLVRRNQYWSKTTCLHLATEADAKTFFAHDGVQAFLTKIWWGDMSTSTQILKLICGFWCPLLIYTNVIAFRVDSLSNYFSGLKEQEKRFKSLESQINYCTLVISSMADTLTKSNLLSNTLTPSYTSLTNTDINQIPLLARNEGDEHAEQFESDIMYIDS